MNGIKEIQYKNLSEFLLKVLKNRPAIFLTSARLPLLSVFLTGYEVASPKDTYFDKKNGFLSWFYRHKGISEVYFSEWTYPFIEEAKSDEAIALIIYFKYLETYFKESR